MRPTNNKDRYRSLIGWRFD